MLVLGAGYQGKIIAKTLTDMSDVEVTVTDIDDSKLKQFERLPQIATLRMDLSNIENLSEAMRGFDIVSGALPSSLGFRSLSAAIKAGVDIVDTSFMPENPLLLNESAKSANISIIPDCGIAPGLSNILIGHSLTQLDKVEAIHIAVGGLPQLPRPPLGYAITWSVRDLIEEYIRPARIVRDGQQITVDALSGLKQVDVPGLGRLESFYTDGLRTLLDTIKGVKEMDERTLRYPGHVEKVKVLRDCGFFSDEPVTVDGCRVSLRDVSTEALLRSLIQKDERDVTILQVLVTGEKNSQKTAAQWLLLDYYDEAKGISSMSRTTAYTNLAVCTLLLRGMLKEKGVIPPERLGMNVGYSLAIMSELEKRGVKVEERISRD